MKFTFDTYAAFIFFFLLKLSKKHLRENKIFRSPYYTMDYLKCGRHISADHCHNETKDVI